MLSGWSHQKLTLKATLIPTAFPVICLRQRVVFWQTLTTRVWAKNGLNWSASRRSNSRDVRPTWSAWFPLTSVGFRPSIGAPSKNYSCTCWHSMFNIMEAEPCEVHRPCRTSVQRVFYLNQWYYVKLRCPPWIAHFPSLLCGRGCPPPNNCYNQKHCTLFVRGIAMPSNSSHGVGAQDQFNGSKWKRHDSFHLCRWLTRSFHFALRRCVDGPAFGEFTCSFYLVFSPTNIKI